MKLYELKNKFYPTKQKAIEEAKRCAAPQWNELEQIFEYDTESVVARITIVELSNAGHVCDLINDKTAKPVGIIDVTSDMSLRERGNPNAKITFSIKKENFND